jgi:hypothetical protein
MGASLELSLDRKIRGLSISIEACIGTEAGRELRHGSI